MTTLFFVVSNVSAYACSCGFKDMPFNDVIKASEIVFLGTAIETKPVNPEEDCSLLDFSHLRPEIEPYVHCRGEMVTRFKIATPIKGDVGETFDIHHGINGASCGISFQPDALTYIHTSSYDGKYKTFLCSRVRLKLETFQAYAETGPEERSCMDQISKGLAPYMEPEILKAQTYPSTENEQYSLSLLNLDPVCEAYWPSYQKTFGGLSAKVFHAIISDDPSKPFTIE